MEENELEKEKFDLLSTIFILLQEYEDVANHTIDCTISFGDDPCEIHYYSPEEDQPFCTRHEE